MSYFAKMSWSHDLSALSRIICTRSMEYVIADSCDITTEQELESNIKIF